MADFRKWIIALAVVLLCAGLASAQSGGGTGTAFSCGVNVNSTPTLRSEGITEQIGDIVITCTGGTIPGNIGSGAASNSFASAVNITVSLTSMVTSRLLTSSAVSEALLLIDEPNSGAAPLVPGWGPGEPFTPCPNASSTSNGCAGPASSHATYVLTQVEMGLPFSTGVNSPSVTPAAAMGNGATYAAPNTYQGVVSGNQVTFYGVPVIPPGTTASRIFRITNVRVNASGIGGGGGGTIPVQASILTNNPSALPISNPTPIVGFVQQSLSTGVAGPNTFGQCNSQCLSQSAVLTFKELFASAFKTRVDPTVTMLSVPSGGMLGQAASTLQNVPGTIYSGESGFTLANGTGASALAASGPYGGIGIADFGTRFTAVFNNIPAGAHVYVSQYNVTLNTTTGVVNGQVNSGNSFAQAITSDVIPDGNGTIPAATTFTPPAGCGGPAGGVSVIDITPSTGNTATASWESITNSPTAIDTYQFAVFISYTASPGTNSPAAGTGTANLRYGPASTVTSASSSAPEPRFLDTSSAKNAISIGICRTVLLFPFVTNQAGFDTGLALANTSTDPFGTTPQAGTCSLNWYGAAAPGAPTTTPSIASGTDTTILASITVPGFQGYMIAVCNFQYAHGFAFVSDLGARNLAMGYLALVIPDPNLNALGGRSSSPFPLAGPSTAEQLGQ